MKDPLQMLAEDQNVNQQFRDILAGKPLKPSPAITEFAMQDAHRLRVALQAIAAIDRRLAPEGDNELGGDSCFNVAQAIARAALAGETK